MNTPDLILHNGKITTLDPKYPEATNIAIKDGRIVGVDDAEEYKRGPNTKVIDLKGRRLIPGLNDLHLHVIRGGLNYKMELRWDGVSSLADALRMLKELAQRTPPVRKMLELGVPVGAGTDATRVASYNPWVSLYWLTTGKTVGGVSLYPDKNCLTREEALRRYTQGSSWFSSEVGKKGAIAAGQLADFVALTDDYFSVPEEQIKGIQSVLTVVGGKIVHATDEFTPHAPPAIPVLPEWSPVKVFGGYGAPLDVRKAVRAGVPMQHQHNAQCHQHGCHHALQQLLTAAETARNRYADFFGLGCDCFAF